MATQNHTVTTRSCALNVVDLITVKTVKKWRNTRKMRIMWRQSSCQLRRLQTL